MKLSGWTRESVFVTNFLEHIFSRDMALDNIIDDKRQNLRFSWCIVPYFKLTISWKNSWFSKFKWMNRMNSMLQKTDFLKDFRTQKKARNRSMLFNHLWHSDHLLAMTFSLDKNRVSWSSNARIRLVSLFTDVPFHFKGDRKDKGTIDAPLRSWWSPQEILK